MSNIDGNTNIKLSLIIAVAATLIGSVFSYAYTTATYGQELKQIEKWMEEKDKRDQATADKITAMREDIVAIKAILEKKVVMAFVGINK